jgi:hypothetical protein
MTKTRSQRPEVRARNGDGLTCLALFERARRVRRSVVINSLALGWGSDAPFPLNRPADTFSPTGEKDRMRGHDFVRARAYVPGPATGQAAGKIRVLSCYPWFASGIYHPFAN